jgi:hypothetical protein
MNQGAFVGTTSIIAFTLGILLGGGIGMEWGSLATQNYILLGSAGVLLITLILLILQVHSATKATRSQAYLNITSQVMELNQFQALHPEIYEIFQLETPTKEQQRKEMWLFFSIVNLYENVYLQWKEGIISGETFNGWKNAMKEDFKLPGFKRQWKASRDSYPKRFAEFIEKEIVEISK